MKRLSPVIPVVDTWIVEVPCPSEGPQSSRFLGRKPTPQEVADAMFPMKELNGEAYCGWDSTRESALAGDFQVYKSGVFALEPAAYKGVEDTAAMDRISEALQRTDLTLKQRMHLVCCAVGDTDRKALEDLSLVE